MARISQPRQIKCFHCGGAGVVSLTGCYAETLALLLKQRKPINGAEMAKLAGIKATAMNNRLNALERFGLARRNKNGRESLWRAL